MALTASNTKVWQWREDTNHISQERIATELGYDALDGSIDFDSHCALIHEHDLKAFKSQWQLVLEGQRKTLTWHTVYKQKTGIMNGIEM